MLKKKITREIEVAAAQLIKERDYWLGKLSSDLVKSSFPGDTRESPLHSRDLKEFTFCWQGRLFSRLMEISKQKDHTLHIILLTGLTALLGRYSGSADIVVGTPIYRQAVGGEFINTALVIRSWLREGITFKELLLQVKQTVVEAVENQAYPIELLPGLLGMSPAEDFPLFDIALVLENIHEPQYLKHIPLNMVSRFLRAAESIEINIQYNSSLYHRSTIERITTHFTCLLQNALMDLEVKVSEIDILSEKEKRQLLVDFNDTAAEYPRDKTIQQLFAAQVEKKPDHIALVAIHETHEKHKKNHQISYKKLDQLSHQLAFTLIEKGVRSDIIVGLMLERSLEMIIAVLAILKAGGAYLPINPGYPQERINYVLEDSRAKILVNEEFLKHSVRSNSPLERGTPKGGGVFNLAYVIYTSGSTGIPKGVMVEHVNVVRLVQNTNYVEFAPADRILQTGALEFDASTFEIWGALLNGLSLYLAPQEKLLHPETLKNIIVLNHITILWMTSPLFNRMVQEDVEIFAGLKNLLVGGDVLSPPHINKVKHRFPQLNIINGYGPTENTTFSTTFLIRQEYKEDIPIGKPIANSTAYIVDRNSYSLPVGVPGELLLGGDGVARGYLNNPELTAKKFLATDEHGRSRTGFNQKFLPGGPGGAVFSKSAPPGRRRQKIYKTGDMARWLQDGNIEFLGRMDHQVKIRGFRIELGEIESQLLGHHDVKEAVVTAMGTQEGDKILTAYIAFGSSPHADPGKVDELREYLTGKLPDFMIPGFIIAMEKLPLTTSGKIDRKALPEPKINTGDNYTAPRSKIELQLAGLFAELLGIPTGQIGIDTHFFRTGGHSLKATQLTAKIHKTFHVIISLIDVFQYPTIRELARYINESAKEKYTAVEPVEKKEYYPVSSIQKRFFLVSQMEGIGTAYNLAEAFIVEGHLDPQRLKQAFQLLIRRHETLRTSFELVNDQAVQRIHDEVEFEIEYYGSGRQGDREIGSEFFKNFIRPFDLSRAPLLRVGLVETGKEKYLLIIDIHHIAADGVSQGILYRDLLAIYDNRSLPQLTIQYKDFSQWQITSNQRAEIERQGRYWLRRFEKKLPAADIFTDFPRPPVQSFKGERIGFTLEPAVVEKINRLRGETNTTLYMVTLAVYTLLLSKYTGQEDIVVGTPAAGREHEDLQNLIGLFINALPMRNYPENQLTFGEFLEEVKKNTINAFANQGYPFDDLLEKLDTKPDISRNPIFDVELVLLNMEPPDLAAREFSLIPYEEYELNATQVDMALYGMELGQEIRFNLFYSTILFKPSTMERFVTYFKEILSTVVKNKNIKLRELRLSSHLKEAAADIYKDIPTGLEF